MLQLCAGSTHSIHKFLVFIRSLSVAVSGGVCFGLIPSFIYMYMYACVYHINHLLFSFPISDDLLGLFDGPITTATPQPTTTDTATPPTARNNILAPQVTSDLSLLEPSPASLKPQVKEPQGSLALTLFENPLGSIRVPSEYASHPVAHEWDNKVQFIVSSFH